MKIKLSFDKVENPEDYTYLHPSQDLDQVCDDAECTEFIADDILSYIPLRQVNSFLHKICRKIRIGGTLMIRDIDISEVMRCYQNRSLDLSQTNLLLYGEQEKDWQFRSSCLNGSEVSRTLGEMGFKIIKNSIKNLKYTVKVERSK